jgi:ferrochelatase
VLPFLRNVTRGRDIPPQRLAAVATNYERFGGVSPINAECRALLESLRLEVPLPVYWGNRNWVPYVADTVRQMASDGIRRALCLVTSAYSGYSTCRQYCEDIDRARAAVGPSAPEIDKLRPFFHHPGFVEPLVGNVSAALATLPPGARPAAHLAFTAHSVPLDQPGADTYVEQVNEASRLVAERVDGGAHPWSVSWQSRSGRPGQPWLEPDIGETLATLAGAGAPGVVLVPVGFVADHMEVVYDLDVVAAGTAAALDLPLARARTVGAAAAFVAMVGELIEERRDRAAPRRALGPVAPVECGPGCCC